MDIPPGVQEHISTFTREAAYPVRTGDRLLGSQRDTARKMRECVCGICVQTKPASNKCVAFQTDNPREVEFQKNELCRSVCLQKNGLKLFERFIKQLLEGIALNQTRPSQILLVMSQDRPKARYLLQAVFRQGMLDLQFFPHRDPMYATERFLPYNIGEKLDATKWYPNRESRLAALLDNTVKESNGDAYRIYIDSDTLQHNNIDVLGIHFKFYAQKGIHVASVLLFHTNYM